MNEEKTQQKPPTNIVTMEKFMEGWNNFWKHRIAGETLVFGDMERFMSRTSGKNLSMLMHGKKMEGYQEASMDKMLTTRQKIAIATVATIVMIALIAFIVLKNEGVINF